MEYNINDVLIHKKSYSKWTIKSKDYIYNDNNLIIDKEFSLYNNNNKNIIINEIDIFKYFIKKENFRTYQSQNRLNILFYYIKHYNNDLQPELIKNDENYIFYRLNKKDHIKELLIDDIISYNNLDLIYKAKDLTQNYNKQEGYKMKIKTIKNHFNENIYILRAGKVKGRNYLIKHGWKVCNNINFYTNNYNTGHYNKHLKYWIFDNNKIERL